MRLVSEKSHVQTSDVSGLNDIITLRVDGDDVIADGITYHVDKSTGDFTTSKNSIDMSAYSPLIYSAYFKTFNTSTFADITGITVPISVLFPTFLLTYRILGEPSLPIKAVVCSNV